MVDVRGDADAHGASGSNSDGRISGLHDALLATFSVKNNGYTRAVKICLFFPGGNGIPRSGEWKVTVWLIEPCRIIRT